jgi:hypothetical protein
MCKALGSLPSITKKKSNNMNTKPEAVSRADLMGRWISLSPGLNHAVTSGYEGVGGWKERLGRTKKRSELFLWGLLGRNPG